MRKVFLLSSFLFASFYVYASVVSAPTDYFRSRQDGVWAVIGTWESSPDNVNWSAATLVPTNSANTISIRFGDTVVVATPQPMDEVIVESGGTLYHQNGILQVNDGAGDDIIVLNGGIFTLASNSNPVSFVGAATANINSGGMLRLSATGLTGIGAGVNANNFIYQHASILEYTLNLAFSSNGVTFFPNANSVTIPIFRTTGNLGLIGGNNATIFNGLFEAGGTITFSNAGTKTFRNGIIGAGNIGNDGTSGKFIINGATAILGGTGSLTVPPTGMDIGTSTSVAMVSNKQVTGNIALLTNSFISLGNFNLTMSGDVSGGSPTAHIVTNSAGKLIINNITGATPRIFPVGATTATYNPMAIFNGSGINYGVRVEIGINPAIIVPLNAVNRTWFVTPNGGTPGTVNTNFFYAAGEANAGFNYSANLELGQHTGVWNVIQTGLVPAGAYQIPTTVGTLGNNIEAPLVLANLYAILAVDNPVSINYFTGIKQNGNHLLKWKLTCNSTAFVTVLLERSMDAVSYITIFSEHATALRCQQPFSYTDDQPAAGTNYYRIKMTDADGKISYSTIVNLINAATGTAFFDIAPNPVTGANIHLKLSAARSQMLKIIISDLQGRVVQMMDAVNLIAGFNTIPVNVTGLGKGTYQLAISTTDRESKILRFVKL